jgi:hypothetical protein
MPMGFMTSDFTFVDAGKVILSNEQIEGGPDTEAMFILCEFLAAVDYFVYRDLKTRLATNVRVLLIAHVKGFITILIF